MPPLIDTRSQRTLQGVQTALYNALAASIWNNITWSRRGPELIKLRPGDRAMQVSVSFWEMETRLGVLQTWLSVSGLHSEPESFSILTWVTTFQGWKKHILITPEAAYCCKEGLQTNNGEVLKCWVNKTNFRSPNPPVQTNPQEPRLNLTIITTTLYKRSWSQGRKGEVPWARY